MMQHGLVICSVCLSLPGLVLFVVGLSMLLMPNVATDVINSQNMHPYVLMDYHANGKGYTCRLNYVSMKLDGLSQTSVYYAIFSPSSCALDSVGSMPAGFVCFSLGICWFILVPIWAYCEQKARIAVESATNLV